MSEPVPNGPSCLVLTSCCRDQAEASPRDHSICGYMLSYVRLTGCLGFPRSSAERGGGGKGRSSTHRWLLQYDEKTLEI